jgi:hypothetical protein
MGAILLGDLVTAVPTAPVILGLERLVEDSIRKISWCFAFCIYNHATRYTLG